MQQPFDANNIKTSPPQTGIIPGSDGLNYHTIELGNQPMGVPTKVRVEYLKQSDALTVESLAVQPSSPISSNIAGQTSVLDYVPWGLGTLGIVLLAGGIYFYRQWGQQKPKTSAKRSRRYTSILPTLASKKGVDLVYCHQCGKRAAQGDRFCRACGTKLRRT
jgi:hypothetical protein